ncbi:UDP-glycosyltransferase [Actinidia chinensis var. chinensis]|uniref:UDP-glycosyltransferase n=1 Tax=Actinidia chinensis var. chinensis TaxID=1590841 RepID=A0A2R6PKK1_ACTCC|nr:UDP-glycosyltransferase [Actinidia chinensis var. chinensis]
MRMAICFKYWDDCVDPQDLEALWMDPEVKNEWINAGETKGQKVHLSRDPDVQSFLTQTEMKDMICAFAELESDRQPIATREISEQFIARAHKGGVKKATHKSTLQSWRRYLSVKESLPSRKVFEVAPMLNDPSASATPAQKTKGAANTTWDSSVSPEYMEEMWNHPYVSKEWSKSGEKRGKVGFSHDAEKRPYLSRIELRAIAEIIISKHFSTRAVRPVSLQVFLDDMANSEEHILILPFMARGHLIPFLALARQIHQTTNFTITITATPLNTAYLRLPSLPTPTTPTASELPLSPSIALTTTYPPTPRLCLSPKLSPSSTHPLPSNPPPATSTPSNFLVDSLSLDLPLDNCCIYSLCALAEIVSMHFVNGVGLHLGIMGIDYSTASWLYKDLGYKAYIVESADDLTKPSVSMYFGTAAAAYINWLSQYEGRERDPQFVIQAYLAGPKNINLQETGPLWLKFEEALSRYENLKKDQGSCTILYADKSHVYISGSFMCKIILSDCIAIENTK